MKLAEISAALVRRSVEVYLRHAYPADSRWRAPEPDLSAGELATDLLEKFNDETERRRDDESMHRYVLRLGNSRYPHMKLVLEENLQPGEYVFGVDTHDDLNVPPDAPDFERWCAVRDHNRKLKNEIEEAWRGEGVPTLADLNLDSAGEPILEESRSVLVVDDDPAIRNAIRTLLERAHLKVRVAENGRQALDMVREDPPHLILMDFQMPEMDGVTCCEALKDDPATRRIPVLLATASQVDLRTLTYADGFLVKPYRQDILFSLVRKLLS